jgi:hypothetical protein
MILLNVANMFIKKTNKMIYILAWLLLVTYVIVTSHVPP